MISKKPLLLNWLNYNGLFYEYVNAEETGQLLRGNKVNWQNTNLKSENNFIYKIHFEEALDLVKNRKAYLFQGDVYVLEYDMIPIICNRFRIELSQSLAVSILQLVTKFNWASNCLVIIL